MRLVALIAILLFAGCGAVEDEPDIAAIVASTEAKKSWRVEMEAVGDEDGEPSSAKCAGAADHARRRLALTCTLGKDRLGFDMRAIGDDVYIKDDATRALKSYGNDDTDRGPKWQKYPADDEDPLAEISPDKVLSLLRGASSASEYVGEEAVRDVAATRYRLTVNCEEAELADCDGETAPVDVWIATDDTVRRISLENGGQAVTIEFFDFGIAVDVEPPPAHLVESVEELEPRPCEEDGGRPIRASRAIEALRRAGFSVKSDREACFDGLAAAIDNTGVPRVLEREGIVMCHVYEKPPSSATNEVLRRGVDGGDAELVLANLECMIFTDSPDSEKKIDKLEKAFDELERAIRR